jgi:hypothetical protein
VAALERQHCTSPELHGALPRFERRRRRVEHGVQSSSSPTRKAWRTTLGASGRPGSFGY